jgi:hypothetical protein
LLRRRVDEAAVGEGGGAVQARKEKADGARRRAGLGDDACPACFVWLGAVDGWF